MAKSNFDKCMGGGKAELLDSLIKKSKKKVKYVFEAGDKVEDKEVVSIWDEFGKANLTVFNNLINNIKKRGDK
jgi:ABC-type uncharacterized transport system auxiliary subunit